MTSSQHGGLSLARRKVDDADVRSQMLQVAVDYIRQEGLTVSLDHLSYELIIQAAAVPRSAAYRLWKKKEDFFADLLQVVAAGRWSGTAVFDQEVVRAALEAALVYSAELDTPEGRKRALLNAARVGIQHEFEHLRSSTDWQTYVSLSATVMSLPDSELKSTLLDNIADSEREHTVRAAEFYATLGRLAGFRIKGEFGGDFCVMASVVTSVVEGFALRSLGTPHLHSRQYILNAFELGRDVDWSMPALACISAIELLLEEDPEYKPVPDLMALVKGVIAERNRA